MSPPRMQLPKSDKLQKMEYVQKNLIAEEKTQYLQLHKADSLPDANLPSKRFQTKTEQ